MTSDLHCHGLWHSGADKVPCRCSPEIVHQPPRNTGTLARRFPRTTEAADLHRLTHGTPISAVSVGGHDGFYSTATSCTYGPDSQASARIACETRSTTAYLIASRTDAHRLAVSRDADRADRRVVVTDADAQPRDRRRNLSNELAGASTQRAEHHQRRHQRRPPSIRPYHIRVASKKVATVTSVNFMRASSGHHNDPLCRKEHSEKYNPRELPIILQPSRPCHGNGDDNHRKNQASPSYMHLPKLSGTSISIATEEFR